MPCPGPNEQNSSYNERWRFMNSKNDKVLFSFQATLWRKHTCIMWYSLISSIEGEENVQQNIAENREGQETFSTLFRFQKSLGYIRQYKEPNGVYSSPFPYRPTAIVRGVLQEWVKELAFREGVILFI